jgi:hypothetical protein
MRIFNLDKIYNVVCNSEPTRYGFRHIAILHKNGFSIAKTKISYYNRTWESYEFESVLLRIIDENFTGREREKFIKKFKDKNI